MTEQHPMAERIARAMHGSRKQVCSWDHEIESVRQVYRQDARAALTALLEPTPDMVEAGCDTLNNEVSWRGKEAEAAYPCHLVPVLRAMIQHVLAAGQTTPATTKGER